MSDRLEIEKRFTQSVMNEIFDAFVGSEKAPSSDVLDALAVVYNKSDHELLRYLALRAKALGSKLLQDHLRSTD
jgi:hypothetical protein